MPVMAVLGYDETAPSAFRRGTGASPGNILGFVTTAGLLQVDQWRKQIGPALAIDEYQPLDDKGPIVQGAKEISCRAVR